MSSSKPTKKDKGKVNQKAEDYQLQVPVQNQFAPLSQNQFPPLPYKAAVTNPSSSHLRMPISFATMSISCSPVANLPHQQTLFPT